MKAKYLMIFCLLGAFGQVQAQQARTPGNIELKVAEASREVLIRAAALGSMQHIKSPLLVIRLYAFSVSGSCIPETHQVCAHHYVLVTSSFDEAPLIHAYDLGVVGEITRLSFAGKETDKVWDLELEIQNYATSALKSNKRLARRTKKIHLLIDENKVEIDDR
ncbi:MAG: hypothetical protein JRJ87_24875 [Deltaproteobacteria bacterium]|nr:hypothetical protein [Deltaproteobacteria bacterium]